MKQFMFASAVLISPFVAGCGKSDEVSAATKSAASKMDVSKLTPEAMKAEGSKLINEITAKLGSIKDLPSAESVKKQLEPMISSLATLKEKLGVGSLDFSSLKSAISDVTAKFGSDTKIMEVLKPVLDKLQGLLK